MAGQRPSNHAALRQVAEAPGRKCSWMQRGILAGVCTVVIGVYASTTHSGYFVSWSLNAADNVYNLLAQGFRDGQLSLKKPVPPAFAHLADPYDPAANALYRNAPYGLWDLSYYKGKLYLYFGATPAVILFWPCASVTGHYIYDRQAVVILCAVGFMASVGLLFAWWRRYAYEVSERVLGVCCLALGLATCTPILLARCDAYEVAISCGYMLMMLALGSIWKALHEAEQRGRWLAAASLAYGLAVGARPNLLFGAVILLVPVAQAWREQRKLWTLLLAATLPIAAIGCGLMLYNALRFDSPFEFGLRYQLAGDRHLARQFFSVRYLWFNVRVYFLEPARWTARFPFVHDARVGLLPAGYVGVDHPFGVLSNVPFVWLALAVPLAWRRCSVERCSVLPGFLMAAGIFVGVGTVILCLYFCACVRYEVEFLAPLVLLAGIGTLSLECSLARTSESEQAARRIGRHAVRLGWSLLLGFSVAFNLLAGIERSAEANNNLGNALLRAGKLQEAIGQYERTLQLVPDSVESHYNLGVALEQTGRLDEAIGQFEAVLRIKSDNADAHNNWGIALMKQGRFQEAIGHFERALQIHPDYVQAQCNWANALIRQEKVPEAIAHYEQALRMAPDFVEAHFNLAVALEKTGRVQEAIQQYELALSIRPDFVQARTALARVRAAQ